MNQYRVHLQAKEPAEFIFLASAIRYIINAHPVWYQLERRAEDGFWEIMVDRRDSR